jgi:hypothetical protein
MWHLAVDPLARVDHVAVVRAEVCIQGPGGGMYSGPGGGLYTGPGGGLYIGPGGGLYTGPRQPDGYNGPWGPCITGVLGMKWMRENRPSF